MAKSTFGIWTDWVDTTIGWIKKGIRRGQVNKIDKAVSDRDASAMDRIVRDIEKARDKRTNAS